MAILLINQILRTLFRGGRIMSLFIKHTIRMQDVKSRNRKVFQLQKIVITHQVNGWKNVLMCAWCNSTTSPDVLQIHQNWFVQHKSGSSRNLLHFLQSLWSHWLLCRRLPLFEQQTGCFETGDLRLLVRTFCRPLLMLSMFTSVWLLLSAI